MYTTQDFYYGIRKKKIMTPDDLYTAGYNDGKEDKAMNASLNTEPNYMLGYEDGKGDSKIEKPVSQDYAEFNDPPEGFTFSNLKQVPAPSQYYLSKGGSATFLTRERRNGQTRHILCCATCGSSDATSCWHHPEIKGRS